jgi:hypothetical protein
MSSRRHKDQFDNVAVFDEALAFEQTEAAEYATAWRIPWRRGSATEEERQQ